MNTQVRHAAFSLAGISIALTLLLAYPEVSRSRAKAHAVRTTAELRAGSTETVEETVTLSPANLDIWTHFYSWYTPLPYCTRSAESAASPEDVAGSIVAGFKHRFDKGAAVFGCPDGSNTVYRGTVWFDLSDIVKKAPPLHIAVKSATLHFKPSGKCHTELLVGGADWMKGYPDNTVVPGDPLTTLGPCGTAGCSIDVETVVNNWLKGAEHGGYANYGFVFKGMQEADVKYGDNDSCVARYGDFSLTVNYRYDKEPVILVVLPTPTPKKPDAAVGKSGISSPLGSSTALATRTNYALAANGGKAVASSTLPPNVPSYVNDGDRTGAGDKVWLDSTLGSFPDYIEIDLDGKKSIDEIDVITRQDNLTSPGEPGLSPPTVFNLYGITAYDVQYWDGGAWVTVASVGSGPSLNDQVWRQFILATPVVTDKIRIQINGGKDNAYSRVVEVEAWGK